VLFNVGYGGGYPYDYLYAPYVNIYKTSSMTPSQVTALLGYQASTRSSETILFIVLLVLGLAALAVGVIALIKFMQAKKLADITSADRV